LLFDLYYSGNSPVPTAEEKTSDKVKLAALVPPVTEETPSFKNIFMKNITCKGAGRAAFLQGLPEMNLKNIQLTNIHIEAVNGIEMIDADGMQLEEVYVSTAKGAAMQLRNVKNTSVSGFVYPSPEGIAVRGELTTNLSFKKTDFKNTDQVKLGAEVNKKSVVIR